MAGWQSCWELAWEILSGIYSGGILCWELAWEIFSGIYSVSVTFHLGDFRSMTYLVSTSGSSSVNGHDKNYSLEQRVGLR